MTEHIASFPETSVTTSPTLPSSISGGHRSVPITWEDCEVTGASSDAEIAEDGLNHPIYHSVFSPGSSGP